MAETGTWTLKTGLAQMLKGGVIMDVVTAEHAKIAEDAGAVAVMALERVPADIRAAGGVARMSDPEKILEIMSAVTIPVMAKCRIGHFVEAQVLEALGVDYVDESEVLTPADKQKLPVVLFCAGGIATPADAALTMQLGAEGNFVGSGIFKSEHPEKVARAIVQATTHYTDAKLIAEVSRGLGVPMRGIALEAIPERERLAVRGWEAAPGLRPPAPGGLFGAPRGP